jgi:hypothetical protein
LATAGLALGAALALVLRKRAYFAASSQSLRHGRRKTLSGTRARGILIAAVALVCLSGWAVYARAVSDTDVLDPQQDERELLRFLGTLPKDVLIAGTPCALDSVQLFAKRQVLFSCEAIGADAELTREALTAYYADDAKDVLDFCQLRGVDYLVVDQQVYSEEALAAAQLFFEPYNKELLLHVARRQSFILEQVSNDAKVFRAGDLFVVPCNAVSQ